MTLCTVVTAAGALALGARSASAAPGGPTPPPAAPVAPAPTPPAPVTPAPAPPDLDVETIDLATAMALAAAETIEIWDERPDKPFDRDTTARLDERDLRARAIPDVAAALALLPDVVVREAGRGGRQIDIRGARRSAVKILVDGVAVDDPYFGNFDLSSIPATDLAQLRVSTAPASPIDGAGGPGGVVELHTRDAAGDAELLAQAAGDSLPTGTVAVTGRHGLPHGLAVRASATATVGDETFRVPGPVEVGEARQSASAAVRLEQRAGDRRTVVDGFGLVRSYVVPPNEDDTAEITVIEHEVSGRASGQLDQRVGRWQIFANVYAHGTTRLSRFYLDPTLSTPEAKEDLRANRAGGGALVTRGLGPRTRAVAAVHLDTEAARVDDGLTLSRGRSTVAELAAGGQLDTGRLRVDGAVGLAVPLGLGAPVSPEGKLVVELAPVPAVTLTATVARKGRLPTLRERYRARTGNTALGGETNDFGEVKVRLGDARVELTSAAWVRFTDGLIKNDPATMQFANRDAIDLYGVDLELVVGRGRAVEGGVSYGYVEASADGAGEPLDFLARHRGQVRLTGRPRPWLLLEAREQIVGQRLDRATWLPAYGALGVTASATHGAWQVAARCDDLLDDRYALRAGVPSSGRTAAVTVTRRWP